MDQAASIDYAFNDVWDTNPYFRSIPASMDFSTQPNGSQTSPAVERTDPNSAAVAAVNYQVCISCRRKKRKCSQERPSCSLCRENGWICEYRYIKKKPGPAKRSIGLKMPVIEEQVIMACLSTPFGIAMAMNGDAMRKLIDLYFTHIQPNFPMLCRNSFMEDLTAKRIPDKLLNAMFALSVGFLPSSELDSLFGSSCDNVRQTFARLAERQARDQADSNAVIVLNDVKSEVLLTLYEYTNFPGRKAWMTGGNMVRTALGMGLNRIDSEVRSPPLTDFELEEHRFVWWSVWKLDSATNCLSASPFGIDNQTVGTATISTSIAVFEAGLVEKSTQQFLPTDSTRSWKLAQQILATDTGDGMNMYLFAVCLLRTVSLCRQRLHANPTSELISNLMSLRNTLSCVRLSLPAWYFDSTRQFELETREKHRLRLETLLIFYLAQVQAFLPFLKARIGNVIEDDCFGNWNECIAFCESIAFTIHHWRPEYSATADPMISAIIWFAWSILTIHMMSIFGQSGETPNVKITNALDLLNLALETFAQHWQISRLLLDSTKKLEIWTWLKIDLPEILLILGQLCVPIDPLEHEPGSIDMWAIIGQRDEVTGATAWFQ